MNERTPSHHKVQASHLQRDAYLYVRQSSIRQVLENTESTKRQYALREDALALGWKTEQIRVIDCDQGRSGASEVGRDGFQQLVAEVSLGNAGIVMGLEVSRLARNNADWHRLLQLCAFTDALILDQDGLYDPASFNDRLLLGLKGTMSEAELHVLSSRLQQGILNKARRGELKMALPAGLVYDELDRVVLTADLQVRGALQRFFEGFQRLGSAMAVVKDFRRHNLQMPHYSRTGPKSSRIIWGELAHSQALRILHNPRYAGAFAYGRARTRRDPDGVVRYHKQPPDQWICLIPDAHEGYISWQEYQANQQTLSANARAYSSDRRSPPREGPALLQGIILCGRCGNRMSVHYHHCRGRCTTEYLCQKEKIEKGHTTNCQRLPGGELERAIGELLVSMINRDNIDIAVAVRQDLLARFEEADRLRHQQVERCRYEADLAQRRYMKVDPDQRYVAQVLEAEWNEKLRALEEAQINYEQEKQLDAQVLDQQQNAALSTLVEDFTEIWKSPVLSHRDRKRMVRLLIEDITILRSSEVLCHIRFKGGGCRTIELPAPRPATELRKTDPEVIKLVDQLLDAHPAYKLAAILNEQGLRSGAGQRFTLTSVTRLRMAYELPTRSERLRQQGKLTAGELAARLGVSPIKIHRCRKRGLLRAHEYNRGHYLFDDPGPDIVTQIPQLRPNAHLSASHTTHHV